MTPQDPQRFTDKDLLDIWKDTRTTRDDLGLLTEDEAQRLERLLGPQNQPAPAPPRTVAPTSAPRERGWGETAVEVGKGILKGAGTNAVGAGQLVTSIPGVAAAIEAGYRAAGARVNVRGSLTEARRELEPTNTPQRAGYMAEQVGEFFGLPTGKGNLVRKMATQGVGAGVLGGVQEGTVRGGVAAGVVGALMPGAGEVVGKAEGRLEEAAQKGITKALGPTKERFKAMAEKVAPEFLQRRVAGVTGTSLRGLQERAGREASAAGQQIDAVLKQHAGDTIATQPVLDALETAKKAYIAPNATRTVTVGEGANAVTQQVPIVLDDRIVNHLTRLQRAITDLGPQATVDDIVAARRVWDQVVNRVGGFQHRAAGAVGMPLSQQSEAWAKREATNAIRKVLNDELPDLQAVNKEYHFWRTVKDITAQTLKREAPQKAPWTRTILTGAGMMYGAGSGTGPVDKAGRMLAYGALANRLSAVFRSPRWKFVTAQAKQDLADALGSGNVSKIGFILRRIAPWAGEGAAVQ